MPNLTGIRRRYARKLRRKAHLRSRLLVRAFAEVRREDFMGPGPWKVIPGLAKRRSTHARKQNPFRSLLTYYRTTPDSNPRHIYEDLLVGIVPERLLNNGLPSFLARCLDALELKRGNRVVHVGCGTGYYTAILAHVVGPRGKVIALEIDSEVAPRARENLSPHRNVEMLQVDGTTYDPGTVDAIFVNAGANFPCSTWLDSLSPDGRLVFPLITMAPGRAMGGVMYRIRRRNSIYEANVVSMVSIFPCVGAIEREADALVREAFSRGGHQKVRTLRRDPHDRDPACWLHGSGFCLSE